MRHLVHTLISLFLLLIITTCYPWDLEKRPDHDEINGHTPDTCCNGDCDVDTCEGPEYITFDTLYGTSQNDEAMGVIITHDGGYAIVGQTLDLAGDDFDTYLLKIDSTGQKKWALKYDITDDDYGVSLTQLDNNNLILLGNMDTDANTWQNLLMETDASGNKEGQDDYGLDKRDITYSFTRRINNTGYLLFGFTETYRANNLGLQAMLFVVDNTLSEVGRKNIGGDYDDYGYSIDITEDNQYVVLVSMGKQDQTRDLHLMKLDQNHDEVWNEVIIENAQPVVGCVCAIPGGGYIIGGSVSLNRLRLVKTDNLGQNPVEETFDDTYADSCVSVIPTIDGGFAALTNNMALVKTNANLKEVWKKEFEGEINGNQAIRQTADRGFILVGFTYNEDNFSNDIKVVKTDPLGEVVYNW